jgi:hypothetical protein
MQFPMIANLMCKLLFCGRDVFVLLLFTSVYLPSSETLSLRHTGPSGFSLAMRNSDSLELCGF